MTHKLVDLTVPSDKSDDIRGLADRDGVELLNVTSPQEDKCTFSVLTSNGASQKLFDDIQGALDGVDDWRMIVLPVSAVIPNPEEEEDKEKVVDESETRTREELYNDVASGAALDPTRLLLVAISAMVACAGMVTDNVAVVIGAMVIAPLIGPLLALTLATTLGDGPLILKAVRTSATGIMLAILVGVLFVLVIPFDPSAKPIIANTKVGFDNVGLALASGAAAALSVTTGISGALVGVMVAVALLPPAATVGMLLGAGLLFAASGAALLLAVNVAAVTLAGQVVLLVQGVRPRTWFEKKNAAQSVKVSLIFWTSALAVLAALIWVRGTWSG